MTLRKRILFWAVVCALPAMLLLAAELAARLLVRTRIADDPEINLVDVPSFFGRRVVNGREYVEIVHPEAYGGRRTRFLAEKPAGELRIFCLGGSASAGWPHPPSEIYSAYLQSALVRALPGRPVEVVNASAHAYASYRVRLIFDNVIDYDPDVLVLYAGNNEFIEPRTYLEEWGLDDALAVANHLVLFRMLRRDFTAWVAPGNVLSGARREHAVEGLRSKLARMPVDLRKDPGQFEKVQEHYARTMEAMVREADRRGVPVLLVTVPVNLRDWHPNVSHNRLSGEKRRLWQGYFDAGQAALLRREPDAAIDALRAALELEPIHAESHFLLGRALEMRGEMEEAFHAYERARDLDHNPFRAIGAFNVTLRGLAARWDDAFLVDAERAFARESAPRAPGFDLFLDYVHPTRRGNLVLAREVFDALAQHDLLGAAPAAPFEETPTRYDERRDVRVQTALLALYSAMHQYQAASDQARWLHELVPDSPLPGRVLSVFPAWLEAERRRLIGPPLAPGEYARAEAALEAFYRSEMGALAGGPGEAPPPRR